MINSSVEVPRATSKDLEAIQGWAPFIVVVDQNSDGCATCIDIVHGNGHVVRTPMKEYQNFGSVNIRTPDGRIVEVATALLWQFHGQPCQERSHRYGGSRYSKVSK